MKQIGVFFGSSSGKTADVAARIHEKIGKERADLRDIEQASPADLLDYQLLIMGIPTWGTGGLQDDWQHFLPVVRDFDLTGKRVALFGLGDQESYPGTFADAMGLMYHLLSKTGCGFIGSWPTGGYAYEVSKAVRGGAFVGLVLDEDNQPELSDQRIDAWLEEILEGMPAVSG